MNIISENKGTNVFNKILIDISTFEINEEIKGLAYVRNIEEATASTGNPFVRFYLQGVDGRVFQANLILVQRLTVASDIFKAVGKLVEFSGFVSKFQNMVLVNLNNSPIIRNDIKFNVSDLYSETFNLTFYREQVNAFLSNIKEHSKILASLANSLESTNIVKLLSASALDMQPAYKGDSLRLAYLIFKDLDNLNLTEKLDTCYLKLLAILYLGLDQFYKNKFINNGEILKTPSIDKIENVLSIAHKIDGYSDTVEFKFEYEFRHLFAVMDYNEQPLTLAAHLIPELYKKNFSLIKLENIFNSLPQGSQVVDKNVKYYKVKKEV